MVYMYMHAQTYTSVTQNQVLTIIKGCGYSTALTGSEVKQEVNNLNGFH